MFRIFSLASVLLINGCASITTGQDQTVSVDTPNCPMATCELTNKEGTYFVSGTPGTVTVNRVCGKLTLKCSKEGYPDEIMTVNSSVKTMAFGNILFGGFIGAGVDAATGAACEYPSMIPVPMNCGRESERKTEIAFEIPEKVLKSAAKMDCAKPEFVGRGPEETDVYSTECEGDKTLMSCTSKGCSMNEYSTGTGASE